MLQDKVTSLRGVGEKTKNLLKKLDIETIEDLLRHYPLRYEKMEEPVFFHPTQPGEEISVYAQIVKPLNNRIFGKKKVTTAVLEDQTGKKVNVIWYNAVYLAMTLKLFTRHIFVGKVIEKNGVLEMEHPNIYEVDEYEKLCLHLQSVYPLTKGITSGAMAKFVAAALGQSEDMNEFLPEAIRQKFLLCDLRKAVEKIHFPRDFSEVVMARKRLAFDEFFLFLYLTKFEAKSRKHLHSLYCIKRCSMQPFFEALPFVLTSSQKEAMEAILADMASNQVMNRLVQGDVGSGKTVIAFAALYAVIQQGYQGALMVPTEVLAKQHLLAFEKLFSHIDGNYRVALLTGSMTKKQREEAYKKIKSHEIDVVIGTHALLQDGVEFDKLALVIADEQHRFGVMQRQNLAQKGAQPHILVMSATPIPRTLAVILYGDLDVTQIFVKPQGRLPIKNVVIEPKDRKKAYAHIAKEVQKGHQAYVICPMVEEGEESSLENVMNYGAKLKTYFNNRYFIEILHGKMQQKEKDDIMERFTHGKIDILVSTTVIEVGVDVPKATVMMIENAERFGLASLHQLRGRVGRSDLQSYCIFVRTSEKENAKKRLDVVGNSNDGFFIASEDLRLRGPGELFGIAQSGEFVFGIADIYSDAAELAMAQQACAMIFEGCVDCTQKELYSLKEQMEKYKKNYYNRLSL